MVRPSESASEPVPRADHPPGEGRARECVVWALRMGRWSVPAHPYAHLSSDTDLPALTSGLSKRQSALWTTMLPPPISVAASESSASPIWLS